MCHCFGVAIVMGLGFLVLLAAAFLWIVKDGF